MDDEPPLFRKKTISNQQQFTVWTSMLKRAMQTAAWFDPDEYDIKHIRFLNEINAAVGYLMSLYFGRTWFIHCSDDRFVKE